MFCTAGYIDDPDVRVGGAPSRQGTIHTGASWMCAARYSAASSSRRKRSLLMPGAGSPAPISWRDLLIPGALIQGPDRLLDLRIADYQEAPALHISATRGTHARFEDLPDQFVWHRVWFQTPHRPGGSDDFEQVGGVRLFLGHDIFSRPCWARVY